MSFTCKIWYSTIVAYCNTQARRMIPPLWDWMCTFCFCFLIWRPERALNDLSSHLHLSGVGASAIYPLLFTSLDKNVCMVGTGKQRETVLFRASLLTSLLLQTDIDNASLLSALHNVEKNILPARIRLLKTEAEAGFFEAAIQANS
jgi:hypothetical protein